MNARPSPPAGARIDLHRMTVLVADDNPMTLDLTAQIVQGLGCRSVLRRRSGLQALDALSSSDVDLAIIDAHMDGMDGYEVVARMRRTSRPLNRQAPAIVVTGHSRESDVLRARDCGASFVIAKPVTPEVLVDRIYWITIDRRAFVVSATYVGPDRRFRNLGPPVGEKGRRADDLTGALGMATEPNLSQDAIDAFMKPVKVLI
jgi:CheY-like chemotaxis protein